MGLNSPDSSSADSPEAAASPAARRQALGRLIDEHNGALHAFLMSRIRDEQEARDVAQEAYVRLLQLDQPEAISFLRA
ncbi:MAG: hypothetical protein JNL55_04275, partial [Steroidobacter sp.]|nr:hypothetical protein [Steroidobacter sp.]